MKTIKPRINRRGCILLVAFLSLISLIGCGVLTLFIDRPVIDKVPPGTPKGFVEFYTFSGSYYPRKPMAGDCYDLQKARAEYSSVDPFAIMVMGDKEAYWLVSPPLVTGVESALPSRWRRFARAPGEHYFYLTVGNFQSDKVPVKVRVTEGMITLFRVEGKCVMSKGGLFGLEKPKGILTIVRSEQMPITSNEKSRALFKQFLNDNDWTIRFYAARILGEIDDPNTTELLIDALKDDIWEVRMQAAFSLVNSKNVRDVRIIDLITTALIEDPKGDNLLQMREMARLLGKIGDERAIAPLERCLDEKYDSRLYGYCVTEVKTQCRDALKKIRQRLNK